MVLNKKEFSEQKTMQDFSSLLKRFEAVIKDMPPAKSVEKELLQINVDAINERSLTIRQTEAITARVKNYLAGNYNNQKN
jgi:hypothetical protein